MQGKKKPKIKENTSNINSNSEDVKELQKKWAWAMSREVTAMQISHIHSKIQFRGDVYAKNIPFCSVGTCKDFSPLRKRKKNHLILKTLFENNYNRRLIPCEHCICED